MPDLSLLVVTYNTVDLAANLLHHLSRERLVHADGSPLSWEWVVVDNASPRKDPGGVRVLEELSRTVPGRFIQHDRNPGYAAGMNMALRHATGDMVLVLNPDMIFAPGCVNRMVAYLETHPDAGAVGPMGFWDEERKIMLPPNIPPTLGDLFWVSLASVSRLCNRFYSLRRTRAAVPYWTSTEPVDVPLLSGCCILLRRSLIEEIGFFDERFPLYYEDTDLFLRIRRSGRRLVMLPDAHLVHFYNRSGVTNETEAMARYWISRKRYYAKWYGLAGRLLFAFSRLLSRSAAARRKAGNPMDRIVDMGEMEGDAAVPLPRHCDRFVVELAQDPSFLLAGGIMGSGDSWRPGGRFWDIYDDSTFFFRVMDLTGGRCRHVVTWSFTRAPGSRARRSRAAAGAGSR